MKRNHVQFFQQELFTSSFMEEMTALAPIKAIISFRWLLEDLLIVWRTYIWCDIQGCWDPTCLSDFAELREGLFHSLEQPKKFCFIIKLFSSIHQSVKMCQAKWSTAVWLFQSHRNDPWSHRTKERDLHWLLQWMFLLTPWMPVGFNPAHKW